MSSRVVADAGGVLVVDAVDAAGSQGMEAGMSGGRGGQGVSSGVDGRRRALHHSRPITGKPARTRASQTVTWSLKSVACRSLALRPIAHQRQL